MAAGADSRPVSALLFQWTDSVRAAEHSSYSDSERNMNRSRIVSAAGLISAVGILAACASPGPWQHATKDSAALAQDRINCKTTAVQQSPGLRYAYADDDFEDRIAIESCLIRKGWHR